MTTFVKDPDATLDYTVDWAEWMTGADVISTVTWTVESGLTQVSTAYTDTTATIWLSGGKAGKAYAITCRVTTDNNPARIDDRSFVVSVENR